MSYTFHLKSAATMLPTHSFPNASRQQMSRCGSEVSSWWVKIFGKPVVSWLIILNEWLQHSWQSFQLLRAVINSALYLSSNFLLISIYLHWHFINFTLHPVGGPPAGSAVDHHHHHGTISCCYLGGSAQWSVTTIFLLIWPTLFLFFLNPVFFLLI